MVLVAVWGGFVAVLGGLGVWGPGGYSNFFPHTYYVGLDPASTVHPKKISGI